MHQHISHQRPHFRQDSDKESRSGDSELSAARTPPPRPRFCHRRDPGRCAECGDDKAPFLHYHEGTGFCVPPAPKQGSSRFRVNPFAPVPTHTFVCTACQRRLGLTRAFDKCYETKLDPPAQPPPLLPTQPPPQQVPASTTAKPTDSGDPESGSANSDAPDAACTNTLVWWTRAAAPARTAGPPVAYGDVAVTWGRGTMCAKSADSTREFEWQIWNGRDAPVVSIGWRHTYPMPKKEKEYDRFDGLIRMYYTVPRTNPDIFVKCHPGFVCRPRVDAGVQHYDFVDAHEKTHVSIGLLRLEPAPADSSGRGQTCQLPEGSPNLIFSASAGRSGT